MKIIIFLLITLSTLFSVPVFAVGIFDTDDISEPPYISTNEATPNNLIQNLNIEYDRLVSSGYGPEDYDISDPMRDIITNTVFPPEIENASQVEKDRWAGDRVPLFESFNHYVENIPDGERKIMFERARDLMGEFTFVD